MDIFELSKAFKIDHFNEEMQNLSRKVTILVIKNQLISFTFILVWGIEVLRALISSLSSY